MLHFHHPDYHWRKCLHHQSQDPSLPLLHRNQGKSTSILSMIVYCYVFLLVKSLSHQQNKPVFVLVSLTSHCLSIYTTTMCYHNFSREMMVAGKTTQVLSLGWRDRRIPIHIANPNTWISVIHTLCSVQWRLFLQPVLRAALWLVYLRWKIVWFLCGVMRQLLKLSNQCDQPKARQVKLKHKICVRVKSAVALFSHKAGWHLILRFGILESFLSYWGRYY